MNTMISRILAGLAAIVLLAGCHGSGETADNPPAVTWYRDVLPIVQKSCLDCHYQGGIAPFPLETYAEASTFAQAMAYSVTQRTMPPWLPSTDCSPLLSSRALMDAEIEVFKTWSDLGAPQGDPADAPAAAQEVRPALPSVDLTLEPESDYLPNAQNTDEYRCFIIDPHQTEDVFLTGYDIQPRTKWQVHHAVVMTTSEVQKAHELDDRDAMAGWDCLDSIGLSKLGLVGMWAPGSLPISFPEGTGVILNAGTVFITQIHYNLINGDVAPDRTTVSFSTAHEPVEQAFIAPIEHQNFDIPANSVGYASTFQFPVPFEATIWGMGPHMHQLGASFHSSITHQGNETCLVDVPRWEFDWQQGYFYQTPIPAHVGDTLSLTCVWNNPDDHNVIWGEKSTDEMCIGYYYITGLPADYPWIFAHL